MPELRFEGLGTHWLIVIDEEITPDLEGQIKELIDTFECQYSRFKSTSEVSQLKTKLPPADLSSDLENMLLLGKHLEELTFGHFNLNIGGLISGYGYNANLSFKRDDAAISTPIHNFLIKNHQLLYDKPLELDLGGVGKGYLIDKIGEFLTSLGYKHYLIDGGGDILVTNKSDHSPWRIAIEHPTDKTKAIGVVSLQNQAIATSSPIKRSYKDFHHLLNPITKRPAQKLISLSIVSDKAFIADSLATAIFVSPSSLWPNLISEFKLEHLAVYPDFTIDHSPFFENLF